MLSHISQSNQPLPTSALSSGAGIHPTGLPNPQIFNQSDSLMTQPMSGLQGLSSSAQAKLPLAVAPASSVIPLNIPIIKPQTLPPARPEVSYFDLPAGLMVPLVKLEDFEYTAIDPKDIRLPPPVPPSERLLKAVEEFYALPSHDRPRNESGWEQLSLYEFFRAKSQAKKQLDDKLGKVENSSDKSKNGIHAASDDEDNTNRESETSRRDLSR